MSPNNITVQGWSSVWPLASFLIFGAQWSHLPFFCRNPVFLLSDGTIPDSLAFWVMTSRTFTFLGGAGGGLCFCLYFAPSTVFVPTGSAILNVLVWYRTFRIFDQNFQKLMQRPLPDVTIPPPHLEKEDARIACTIYKLSFHFGMHCHFTTLVYMHQSSLINPLPQYPSSIHSKVPWNPKTRQSILPSPLAQHGVFDAEEITGCLPTTECKHIFHLALWAITTNKEGEKQRKSKEKGRITWRREYLCKVA